MHIRRRRDGFTLVEMVMVITVIGIIAGIGVASLLSASDALSFLTVRSDMAQSADVAMSRMAEEMRRLRDDAAISTASAGQFTFTDIDGTSIAYSLSGADLMRTTVAGSQLLASGLGSITFRYYDDSGLERNPAVPGDIVLSPLTNIRRIQILLTFQSGSYSLNYQTDVQPRNLRHLCKLFQ